jgi:CheY-like chemotaxis protein
VSTILRQLDISGQCLLNDISNHSDGEKVDDEEEEDGVIRSTVLPFRNEEETSEVRANRTATNARMPTRILIVDDSSMNRYVVVLPFLKICVDIEIPFNNCRKIIRRMLESSINAAVMGEVIVEEADDGSTALRLLQEGATASPPTIHSKEVRDSDGTGEDDAAAAAVTVTGGRDNGDFQIGMQQKRFDLIFMDYVMTTMNGPEAVQIMRRNLNFSGGIIGVTGNALPSDLTYFEQCGADLVITKPLTIKNLMDAVQSVTQTRKNNILA